MKKVLIYTSMFLCLTECIVGVCIFFNQPKISIIPAILTICLFAFCFVWLFNYSKRKGYFNKKDFITQTKSNKNTLNSQRNKIIQTQNTTQAEQSDDALRELKILSEQMMENQKKINEQLKNKKYDQSKPKENLENKHSLNEEYLTTELSDGKTVKEHMEKDLQNIQKEYVKSDTKEKVTLVHFKKDDKYKINKNEKLFFKEVEKRSKYRLHFDRLSNGAFNVRNDDYIFLGKIYLRGQNCYATYSFEDKDEIFTIEGSMIEIISCIEKWNDYIDYIQSFEL